MATKTNSSKAKKPRKFSGEVFVREELCKGCGFCIEFCPTDVLELSSEFNPKGYHYPVVVREEECTGCDLCGLYCPDFSIFAVRYLNPQYAAQKNNKKEKE